LPRIPQESLQRPLPIPTSWTKEYGREGKGKEKERRREGAGEGWERVKRDKVREWEK